MSKKISWGTGIALLYSGFVLLIVSLVVATNFKKSELVTTDYYQQELSFQQRINAAQAVADLKQPLQLTTVHDSIIAVFPLQFKDVPLTGNVHFYAADNAGNDRSFNIQTGNGSWAISRSKLPGNHYHAQVSWEAAGKSYYQDILLNL